MGHKETNGGGDLLLLLVGGLLGAGAALLLAPQAGKKTRAYLADLADEVGGKANKAASEFSDLISDFVDSAGTRAGELLEDREYLTKESKKLLLTALDKAQEKLQEQRKRLEDSIG